MSVSPKEIGTILRSKTGENTLFDLDLDGSRRTVILKEFQLEPIKGALLHADFYEVALDKLLQVNVHVELVGTPVGVKVQGGIVDWVTRELEIECASRATSPRGSPSTSAHLEIGKHVRVADIKVAGQGHDPDRARRRDRARGRAACGGGRGSRRPRPLRRRRASVAEPEVIKKGKATAEGEAAEEKAAEKPEKKAEKKEKK